jgi:hypothetical protein
MNLELIEVPCFVVTECCLRATTGLPAHVLRLSQQPGHKLTKPRGALFAMRLAYEMCGPEKSGKDDLPGSPIGIVLHLRNRRLRAKA